MYIDDTLSWDSYVKDLSIKLSRSIGVLCKLHHYTPFDSLISVYYAISYSRLVYSCAILELTQMIYLGKLKY